MKFVTPAALKKQEAEDLIEKSQIIACSKMLQELPICMLIDFEFLKEGKNAGTSL